MTLTWRNLQVANTTTKSLIGLCLQVAVDEVDCLCFSSLLCVDFMQ